MRTRVAIVGAGPAGLLLSHLLDREGIESVLLENRSEDYVLGRIRAGVLESSSVDLLEEVGLADRIRAEGKQHRGIYLQWPHERHHLDFVEHVGRSVWIYGQTELTKDLMTARKAAGQRSFYEAADVRLHDLDADRPSATFIDAGGTPRRVEAEVIAGCDGFHGPSRTMLPASVQKVWERVYPYAWLGVLADVAPSTDELIYAWHPDGFALHSMRSETVSRLYLQVDPDDDVANWSDARIWDALAARLGDGQEGWALQSGPILEKSILPMRSFVSTPMGQGRLFLAGDAAHIVPPTGAKGLNLAIADVTLLSRALVAWLRHGDPGLAEAYSETALRRVWRCTHFSWWMTSMLHRSGDDFDAQLQLSQLRWVASSHAGASGLAENYAGLPIGY
ncbi:MAG TPA: 4-hydroxybenzoate 3-monooxygenase [Nocardioidaceae bacterium]|jgi:p-hydroxybenzoate 3-monooxygenase|nr:4-hydroxybenzoate 3-monooxygenase [Nocardioidaceae bacterium]